MGSKPLVKTIGIVAVAVLAATAAALPLAMITVGRSSTRSAASLGSRSNWPSATTIFDRNIPPFDIIGLFQALLERGHKGLIVAGRRSAQKPDRRQR